MFLEDRDIKLEDTRFIEGIFRGRLKFPQALVVNAVLYTTLVLNKLTEKENVIQFLKVRNQKELSSCPSKKRC